MTQSGVSPSVVLIAACSVLHAGTSIAAPRALPPQVVTFESLVDELRSPDPAVRRQALRLLTEARYPEAAEPIAALITGADADMRLEAMAAELSLFLVEPPASRRRVGLIFEQRGPVPAATIFEQGPLALGGHAVPDAVFSALLDAMPHSNARIGLEAIYTLGVLAPGGSSSSAWRGRAAGDLARALTHPERTFRQAALRVIGRVFRPSQGLEVDGQLSSAVIAAMTDGQQDVRVSAMETIGALRDARGVHALIERFEDDGRGREGETAFGALTALGHPSAVPIFLDQLTSGSAARRRLAVEGLARSGPPNVLGDIQAGLSRQTDRTLALAAAFAAARLGDGPLDPILNAVLQTRFETQAFGYLTELVGQRQKALMAHVRDPDLRLRTLLADAVAVSGDRRALPLVETLLGDPDPAVAAAAARAASWLQARR